MVPPWAKLRKNIDLILFVTTVLIYLANGRVIGSGDTLPARYLPISIVKHHTFYLDDFPVLYDETASRKYSFGRGTPYYLLNLNGHYVSKYPPGPAVLALPVYALPVMAGMPSTSKWIPHLEKLSATLITALSVLFLFWALRKLIAEKWALLIAVVYAFGTSSFSISSQALWQHGPSQLFLTLALYFLVRGAEEDRYLPYAVFALASSVVMRPTDALIALPIGLYLLYKYRHLRLKFVLFSLPPAVFSLSYYYLYLGNSVTGFYVVSPAAWQTPFTEGISGLLFSPSRGLFVYSPILLLSVGGILIACSKGPSFLKFFSLGALLVVALHSKFSQWWGGYCYGPRYFADLAPFLCFLLYPVCQRMEKQRLLMCAFIALGLLSIGLHALGAFWYDGSWDSQLNQQNLYRLWEWSDSPITHYGRHAYWSAGQFYETVKHFFLKGSVPSTKAILTCPLFLVQS